MTNSTDTSLPGEEWRPISGTDDLYEVSNLGRVRSWARNARGRVIKPQSHQGGYVAVVMLKKRRAVHRLVLEVFVGLRPHGMVCRHLDGNKTNNRLDNLKWGTYAENLADMKAHGTHANAAKTHCTRGHEYTPENTRFDNRGHRHCKMCNRLRKRSRPAA
ncbi:NUMOD4 motif-containing HNH endonuclease [Streptomyces cyaneofuscatus]|uniref:NUMOD4 motif-containing HNH endonuclease n=1 Tax=Streptomyces cyaneofuscatus TaxID=66883 RepID=UPI003870BAB7|nr:NUMOD4 motif-containing HNH endonuclease [Streptomyces cyaneofuscatus]